MQVYRKGTGETYVPFNHFEMTTQAIFNPDCGSELANVTLSTLKKGSGSHDEVHPYSDQIFYMVKGEMCISSGDRTKYVISEGDAILVKAGDVHAVINEADEDCSFVSITVPPLERTH